MIVKALFKTDADGNLQGLVNMGEAIDSVEGELGPGWKPVESMSRRGYVRSLYDHALTSGLAKITIKGESGTGDSLETRKSRLKTAFKLKELEVVPNPNHATGTGDVLENEKLIAELGAESAKLCRNMLDHTEDFVRKVAIGGGGTMHSFVAHLGQIGDGVDRIIATNFVTRTPVNEVFDSAFLAMLVHFKSKIGSADIVCLPPLPEYAKKHLAYSASLHRSIFENNPLIRQAFNNSKDPDIVFVGAGGFHEGSKVIKRVWARFGVSYEEMEKHAKRPVGDINLSFYDHDGNDLTVELARKYIKAKDYRPIDEGFCHPFLVAFNVNWFKHLVENGKRVILVAGHHKKTTAILPLLQAGVVNGLVTDEGVLDHLLERITKAQPEEQA